MKIEKWANLTDGSEIIKKPLCISVGYTFFLTVQNATQFLSKVIALVGDATNFKYFCPSFRSPSGLILPSKRKCEFLEPCLLFTSFLSFLSFPCIHASAHFLPCVVKKKSSTQHPSRGKKTPSKCGSLGFQALCDDEGPFLQPRTPRCVNQSKKVFAPLLPFFSIFVSPASRPFPRRFASLVRNDAPSKNTTLNEGRCLESFERTHKSNSPTTVMFAYCMRAK